MGVFQALWYKFGPSVHDRKSRMTELESIGLEHLRHIRRAVDDVRDDVREVKVRLGNLENQYASISNRLDRLEGRVERIERRLDLSEASV